MEKAQQKLDFFDSLTGHPGWDNPFLKVKTYLNTKCTPCRPFVKRFEELLKGAHPYILMKIMNKLQLRVSA